MTILQQAPKKPTSAVSLIERGLLAPNTDRYDGAVVEVADQLVLGALLEGKSPALRKSDTISRLQSVAAATDPRFKRQVGRDFKKYKRQMETANKALKRRLTGMFSTYGAGRGKLPYFEFETNARKALRNAHERAFELGLRAAGLKNPAKLVEEDPTLRKRMESAIEAEMKFFNKMLDEMREGALRGSPAGRSERYVEADYSSFNQARVMGMPSVSLIHWHLESGNPCNDCKLIASFSPYTRENLPTVPKAGMSRCLDRCMCSLEVEPVTEQRIARTRRRHITRREMITRIKRQQKKQMGRSLA